MWSSTPGYTPLASKADLRCHTCAQDGSVAGIKRLGIGRTGSAPASGQGGGHCSGIRRTKILPLSRAVIHLAYTKWQSGARPESRRVGVTGHSA